MIGSLCSGTGALDLAAAAVTGLETAWMCEYDKDVSRILVERFPGIPNLGDITAIDWTAVEPVTVLTAGYPCQPFSHAGKRKGRKDERHIWPHVAHAIGVLRPRLVLLENVAGHLSLGMVDVLGDLAALGYDAGWGVVRLSDAGAPHGRARVFIAAEPADAAGGGDPVIEGGDARHQPQRTMVRTEPRTGNRDSARDIATRVPIVGGSAGPQPPATDTRRLPGDTGRIAAPRQAGNGRGLDQPSGRDRTPAADADGERHGRRKDSRPVGPMDREDAGPARQRQRPRPEPGDRSGTDWGAYEPAIRRWEHTLRRPAPSPTEPGRNGAPRLSPKFVEWLMGLPAGWVTDIPITRNAQLKALGNGVVPQQAVLAYTLLGVA